MTTDPLEQFSEALADRLAAASRFVVAIRTGRRDCSGILWRDDVVVTSEQLMPEGPQLHRGSQRRGDRGEPGRLRRRAPTSPCCAWRRSWAPRCRRPRRSPRPGSLALIVGADARGAPTGRLGMVHATGPEWHSQTGGRIEALLRLDAASRRRRGRAGADTRRPAASACPPPARAGARW